MIANLMSDQKFILRYHPTRRGLNSFKLCDQLNCADTVCTIVFTDLSSSFLNCARTAFTIENIKSVYKRI